MNTPEGKVVAILDAPETVVIGKRLDPTPPQQSDDAGPRGPETDPVTTKESRDEQKARERGYMKHFLRGVAKQVFSSLPPVVVVRQLQHNFQVARVALNHASEGDWDLAGSAMLDLPPQSAEVAAGIIAGPVHAAMALPATIQTVMNAPDPEVRGAAAVVAVQQTAMVVLAVVGASRGMKKDPGPTIDRRTGQEVGRFVVDAKGNAMIEPKGGSTAAAGKGGVDTHTCYPNGSNYQRLNPSGHTSNTTPHGHGHAAGTPQ